MLLKSLVSANAVGKAVEGFGVVEGVFATNDLKNGNWFIQFSLALESFRFWYCDHCLRHRSI